MQVKFHLINMREAVVLVLFKGGILTPIIVSVSDAVKFSNYAYPSHGRLALTVSVPEMFCFSCGQRCCQMA